MGQPLKMTIDGPHLKNRTNGVPTESVFETCNFYIKFVLTNLVNAHFMCRGWFPQMRNFTHIFLNVQIDRRGIWGSPVAFLASLFYTFKYKEPLNVGEAVPATLTQWVISGECRGCQRSGLCPEPRVICLHT